MLRDPHQGQRAHDGVQHRSQSGDDGLQSRQHRFKSSATTYIICNTSATVLLVVTFPHTEPSYRCFFALSWRCSDAARSSSAVTTRYGVCGKANRQKATPWSRRPSKVAAPTRTRTRLPSFGKVHLLESLAGQAEGPWIVDPRTIADNTETVWLDAQAEPGPTVVKLMLPLEATALP
jgi:hypothetical protein